MKGFGLGRGAATIAVRSGKLLADIAELDLYGGKASAQMTVNSNEIAPRYTAARQGRELRGGPGRAAAVRRSGADRPLDARPRYRRCRADAGRGGARAVGQGGPHHARRRPRGARYQGPARRGKGRGGPPGWGLLAKGQTSLEQVEARAHRRDGVLLTEMVQARSGSHRVLPPSGRVDLAERTLDLTRREAQRADRSAAQVGRHGRRRGRDDARLLARAVRARGGQQSARRWRPRPTNPPSRIRASAFGRANQAQAGYP